MPSPLFIDTDNALGSPRGDVDDAWAVAAFLGSGAPAAIGAVAGNTPSAPAYRNNQRLCQLAGYRGPVLSSEETIVQLRGFRGRLLALGPLTNVAAAMPAAEEVIFVGGNASTRGRWPPVWPHEFNLTFDRQATLRVFHSEMPLTIFPLDVARRMFIRRCDLDPLRGPVAAVLREGTERWWRHLRRIRLTGRFPIYDLPAALYAIDANGFEMEETTATMASNTLTRFGHGTRPVRLCRGFDRDALWSRAVAAINRLPMAP